MEKKNLKQIVRKTVLEVAEESIFRKLCLATAAVGKRRVFEGF